MPYITQKRRALLVRSELGGELNFEISDLIDKYVGYKGLSYKTIEEIISALQGAQYEFQRKIVGPYENLKAEENGEVFIKSLQQLERLGELKDLTGKLPVDSFH